MGERRGHGGRAILATLPLGVFLCLWGSGCELGDNTGSTVKSPTVATTVGAGGAQPSSGAGAGKCGLDGACPEGQYCSSEGACTDGCDEGAPCSSGVCDTAVHECVECLLNAQCGTGMHCADGACEAGCETSNDCDGTDACCAAECVALMSSAEHCGACGASCARPHAKTSCVAGACAFGGCEVGFADCDLDEATGCEHALADGPCACEPGKTKSCYTGLPSTLGVGLCVGGIATCNTAGDGYGPCVGEVVPITEVCGNGLDDDCSGGVDDPFDVDGDGWNRCEGDCCETIDDCSAPALVNPGAAELADNGIDDDCDATIDNVVGSCDAALASDSASALDFGKALGLCQSTVDNPALPKQRRWGLISGKFALADGSGAPAAQAHSIRAGFGSGVLPLEGKSLVVLSTGSAAAKDAPNDTAPNWEPFQPGKTFGSTSSPPSDWLAAHAGVPPVAPGCPGLASPKDAFDSIQLVLRMRVPTNARGIRLSAFHASADYPEWVCSPYNDPFLALLDSSFSPGLKEKANPSDKNLAFASVGGQNVPLGVNLALGNSGLFRQCQNAATGCATAAVPGSSTGCLGTNQLVGSGFDVLNAPAAFQSDPTSCAGTSMAGGGTGWLEVDGNVVPGETIEMRFVLWDVGDGHYDSLVLLDDFRWLAGPSNPGVQPN